MKERGWHITYYFRDEDGECGIGSTEFQFVSRDKLTSSELEDIKKQIKEEQKCKSVIIVNVFELEKE